jgi:hypothetical protein
VKIDLVSIVCVIFVDDIKASAPKIKIKLFLVLKKL